MGVHMRKIFILFALVFALAATATVVTTAVSSDTAMALATR
jgi:hypothetical protein